MRCDDNISIMDRNAFKNSAALADFECRALCSFLATYIATDRLFLSFLFKTTAATKTA